ncbi:MAG: RNA polymerase sigma factor [Planctomycetaceae bacterium]
MKTFTHTPPGTAATSRSVADEKTDLSAPLTHTIEDSDELLLLRYSETGDRGLFETLMRRYEREIYSYLRRYIGNAELAEDAFQGTFVQVHSKCQQFDSSRRFRPWLYAIATNQAIDVQRRSKRHRMVSLDAPSAGDTSGRPTTWADKLVGSHADPMDAASEQEEAIWINEAVHSLGDSLERVVQLVYYQGMKYREAADVLGIPVGTVKSRLHAAVQRLSALWKESADDDGE